MSTVPTADPPPQGPLSSTDLDVTLDQPSAERTISVAPLTDAVRDPSGAAGLGYLVTLADMCTSIAALCAVVPDWTVTADLMLHEVAPLVHGPTVLDCNLTRAGARLVAVGVDIYDGEGLAGLDELDDPRQLRRTATGIVNFARVASDTSNIGHLVDPLGDIGKRRHMAPAIERPTTPLFERCGISVIDAPNGVVEVPKTDYVCNNRDTFSGGVLGIALQAAVEAAHPGYAGSDIAIHYLSSARVGPVRTSARVLRESPDHVVCRAEAFDAGADDLAVAQATITLQRYTRSSSSSSPL